MKLNCLVFALLLAFLGSAIEASAQQRAAERKEFQRIKAKAQKGDPQAELALAFLYASGNGVARDLGKAAKWARKAADQGLARAQFELAGDYAEGMGVKLDKAEAFRWYRDAADQNLAEAQLAVGRCYAHGDGVSENVVEAVKWYQRAASQGSVEAGEELGECFLEGTGVATDTAEGVKWLRKAAERGYAPAQNRLGLCYLRGQGVTKDFVQAYKWFDLGAAQGGALAPDIKVNLAKAQSNMTPEQIAQAQQSALEFKPRAPSDDLSLATMVSQRSGVSSIGESIPASKGLGGLVSVDALDVTSDVYVDGSFVGNPPAKVHLSEGSHLIQVKKSGFREYRKEIQVSNGAQLNLHVALEKQ